MEDNVSAKIAEIRLSSDIDEKSCKDWLKDTRKELDDIDENKYFLKVATNSTVMLDVSDQIEKAFNLKSPNDAFNFEMEVTEDNKNVKAEITNKTGKPIISSTLKLLTLTVESKSVKETFTVWDMKQRGQTSKLFHHKIILTVNKSSKDLTVSVKFMGKEISASPVIVKQQNENNCIPDSLEIIFSNLDNELETQGFGT